MKKIMMLFIGVIFSASLYSQTPAWLWVKGAGSHGFGLDYGESIAVDNAGNVFATGNFRDTIQFGNTTLLGSGSEDIFMVKYDSSGNVLWANKAGGTYPDWPHGISTDNFGNCYVAGFFLGTAYFDSQMLVSNGIEPDIFIAKYNSNGICVWAKRAGGPGQDRAYAIKTDGNGNSYVTGYMNSTATFGSSTVNSYGMSDIFIAKYDSAGNVIWVKRAGSTEDDYGSGISIDAGKNCYVTGSFSLQATFGNINATSNGELDIFIAQYDSLGNEVWVRKAGGLFIDEGKAITTDNVGNTYVTGRFDSISYFVNNTMHSLGGADIFVAKYDSSGNEAWVKQAGGGGSDHGLGIAIDAFNNCYVTGHFVNSASFGNITLPGSPGALSPFIAKYSAAGNELWGLPVSCKSNAEGRSIAVRDSDNIYTTGLISDTAYFGNSYITSNGYYDVYIAKLGYPVTQGFSVFPNINAGLTLYPNPATQLLTVTNGNSTIHTIQIYNAMGQKCMASTFVDGAFSVSLNISNLKAGIYFIKLNDELNQYLGKLLIGAH